jgi:imidazolonepropionase
MSQIYKNATGQLHAPAGEAILIRGARQLATMHGAAGPRRGDALNELSVIPDGALLIRDGRIEQAGPTRRVENLKAARNAREINATGRVVMPGFVDSRAELWPVRSRLSQAEPGGAALGRSPLQLSSLPGRLLAARARRVLTGMARHGTTTVCAGTSAAMDQATELRMLRAIAGMHGNPLDVFGVYTGSAFVHAESGGAAALMESLCTQVMPAIWRRKLARFAAANGPKFEPAAMRRFLECARRIGFRLRVGAAAGAEGIRLALEMEAESVAVDSITEEDIGALARSRTIALFKPAAGFRHAVERGAGVRRLIESGAAVALASGFGMADGPTYNMQMVISLACSEMGFTPAEALTASTINAAHALGCADACGSLEPGKQADLILLNIEDYRDLSHRFGINHVHMVLKNGAVIYREGEVAHWNAS